MEVSNINHLITPFDFYITPRTEMYGQELNGVIGIDPGGSVTTHRRLDILRTPDGFQRLEEITFTYQLLRGVFITIVPTLTLVNHNESDVPDYINIDITNTGYTTTLGTVIMGISTVDTPTYLTTTDGDYYLFEVTFTIDASDSGHVLIHGTNYRYTELIPYDNMNNVSRVDATFGDDTTASRTSNPFRTIGAALTASQPGDVILIAPGVYEESLIIPDNITILGLSQSINQTTGGVVIQSTNVTGATDLITMGENSKLENLTLYLHSTLHLQLRGIVLPGTTSLTSQLNSINLIIDNSTAPIDGSSNIYGIHSIGTGTPTEVTPVIRDSSIILRSIGGGAKRGILLNTNGHNLYARNTIINVTSNGINVGTTNSYIGMESAVAGGILGIKDGTINAEPAVNGSMADISQTAGMIILGDTNLVNATSNSLSFSTNRQPQIIVWADPAQLPLSSTNYYRPGTTAVGPTEITIRLSTQAIIKNLSVRAQSGPGLGNTNTWTIRRNSTNTGLTVSLTGTDTFTINTTETVTFQAGDLLSLMITTTAGSATDTIIQVDVY